MREGSGGEGDEGEEGRRGAEVEGRGVVERKMIGARRAFGGTSSAAESTDPGN